MTFSIGLLLAIIGIVLALFTWDRYPADVIGIGLLLTLVLTGLLPATQAFAGFGSDTVVMMFGLLTMTAALVRTGVVDMVGRAILGYTGHQPERLLTVIMGAAALMSAVISNTASTAFFVPITLDLARRTRTSAAKLLMPLAFAAILSSSVTVVSSSTNLVVSGVLRMYDMPPLGMFELTMVGLPIMLLGLAYMQFIGQRMIPDRIAGDSEQPSFGIHPYMMELMIAPDSSLVGKTLAEAALGRDFDLTVLRVARERNRYMVPQAKLRLEAEDQLLVKGRHEDIVRLKDVVQVKLKGEIDMTDPRLQSHDTQLVEVILLPRSRMLGRTLRNLRFRQRYGLQVLGLNRRGKNIYRKLSLATLRVGDLLLVQGPRMNIAQLAEDNVFQVLRIVETPSSNRHMAPIAISAFLGAVLLAAVNILPISVAMLLGAFMTLITGCITPERVYRAIEWKALLVIGSMLAMGSAMEYTGTAAFIATHIVAATAHTNPVWLLTAFFVLTMTLTQPMSNQAAAVVVLPIALQTALQLGLNPRTFAVMIAVGASCSFITPLEPACLMVYGPGRYKFLDFVKVGSILTVLIYLIAILMVPWLWPL